VKFFFDAEKFLRFFLLDRSNRNAGPARDYILDVLTTDDASSGFIQMIFLAEGTEIFTLFALLVRVEARLLELVVRNGVLHPVNDELDPLLNFGDFLGQRSLTQLHACSGFVD
jgi:hypothetical protein